MTKIIGIVLVVMSASLVGNGFAMRLFKRAELLRSAESLCREVGENIRFSGSPLKEIIAVSAEMHNELQFLTDFPNIEPGFPFAKKDATAIREFFAGLGVSDLAGQQKHCEAYARRLARLQDEAEGEYKSKSRLYRVLGVFGGICAAVVLI